ncbi:uncharacterized protein BJ171DRAFT_119722 [Polychytrium aggregatum]|uniref:uncharacterized protein n=1 Tax=Polychytrium aggregatum TaxID=110093 RepID=UPI0022FF4600|nr:uncharacterized protein BJ171DRAFT_119722 [Polychytrium aggregatum]KAI9204164.1 hypothetical protein BJ171DRAFT_119722 [Polychytrium aggregatum]
MIDHAEQPVPLPSQPQNDPAAQSSSAHRSEHRPRKVIGAYRLTKTLGQGSMGKVKLAVHSETGAKYACKIVPRPPGAVPIPDTTFVGPTHSIRDLLALCGKEYESKSASKSSSKTEGYKEIRIIREAAIMLLLDHPHICALYDFIVYDGFYYLFFENVNGGQMLDYIISHGKLKEKLARKFMTQIVSAVDYCHQNSIVHRDLKIENILIDRSGMIKLIDFGLSNLWSPHAHLSTFCGSLYFAAPELLSAKIYVGPEVDIWSMGVILYVLVCGKVPFDDTSMPVLHAKIKAGNVEYPSHLSNDCKRIISRMLTVNPVQRATMQEIKNHPWMTKGMDEIVSNLIPDRLPLTPPFDMEVIKRMKGFEFGSDQDVHDQLMRLHQGEGLPLTRNLMGGRFAGPDSPLISIYHLVEERMARERAGIPRGQLQSAYPQLRIDTRVQDSESRTFAIPGVVKRQASTGNVLRASTTSKNHPNVVVMEGRTKSNATPIPGRGDKSEIPEPPSPLTSQGMSITHSSSFGNAVRRLSIAIRSKPHIATEDGTEPAAAQLAKSWHPKLQTRSTSERVLKEDGAESIGQGNAFSDFWRAAVSGGKKSIQGGQSAHPAPIQTQQLQTGDPGHGERGIFDMEMPPASAAPFDHRAQRPTAITFTDKTNTMTSTRTQDEDDGSKVYPDVPPELSGAADEEYSYGKFGTLQGRKGRADDHVTTISLKGLFSVMNTSTKSPKVIRECLLQALNRMGIIVQEYSGGFECEYLPSVTGLFDAADGQPGGVAGAVEGSASNTSNGNSNAVGISTTTASGAGPLQGKFAPLTFLKNKIKGSAGNSISFDATTGRDADETPPASAGLVGDILPPINREPTEPRRGHGRSLSSSNENSTFRSARSPLNQLDFSGSGGSVGLAQGSSSTSAAAATSNVRPIHFEVIIVKMMWVNLHGVQFRRISGDAWLYKRVCTKILDNAHL